MARAHVVVAIFAALSLVMLGSVGCGIQCDRNPNEPPVVYREGIFDRVHETYASADFDGPFLDFPPGRTYRFYHQLGGKPEIVQAWLSFAESPTQGGDNKEGFVETAGNQVTYEQVTCDYIDVRNDTCADVRIRIAASAPDPSFCSDAAAPSPTASDAGDAGH
jgi:hypothetical protein